MYICMYVYLGDEQALDESTLLLHLCIPGIYAYLRSMHTWELYVYLELREHSSNPLCSFIYAYLGSMHTWELYVYLGAA
jgi:hypothetical protein